MKDDRLNEYSNVCPKCRLFWTQCDCDKLTDTDKLKEIRDKYIVCNCDPYYKQRGLSSPYCIYCNTDDEVIQIQSETYQLSRDEVIEIITPLLNSIINSRKCSIGGFYNTYDCQISVKRVDEIQSKLNQLKEQNNLKTNE